MICGIDPGITGALALVTSDGDRIVDIQDMPVVETGSKKSVSAAILADMINGFMVLDREERLTVYVEKVGAMPGQGVTSMFNFGRSAGIVEGVLAALEARYIYVTPQAWKKRAKLTGKGKDAARGQANSLWPESVEYFKRKKDQGRADAALIAYYGKNC